MNTNKKRKQKATLKDMVQAAHAAGVTVNISLEPNKMPIRFPNDHHVVKMLIAECERVNKLGNKWLSAEVPNYVAGEACLRHGWAFSLAAAWLRCELESPTTTPKGQPK